MNYKIDVVFVTYKPDIEVLTKAITSVKDQVGTVYIIDNSENDDTDNCLVDIINEYQNTRLVRLYKNSGIGKAQNIGILKAIEDRADFTLLSDQDTIYPQDYIKQMFSNYDSIADTMKIAAIAPVFRESNKGGEEEGFFSLEGINSKRTISKLVCEDVAQVIASGMIINNNVLSDIGMMDENLFIDWVDFEWCWRARALGYRIIGCKNVIISHTLGDTAVEINGKKYSFHSPERNYYIVRNGIYIALTKKYLAFRMRWYIFLKSMRYMIGFTLFNPYHAKNMIYCAKGFYHGLIGRLGPWIK